MRDRRCRLAAVAVLAGVLALGGCGDDADDDAGEPPRDEAASSTTTTTEGRLQPAGTELADGLLVPEGARLAGTVFPSPEGWSALLLLDEGEVDPFAVLDTLAADIRAIGPAMPGTADSCSWRLPEPEDGPPPLVAVAGPAPPADQIERLVCEATAQDADASFTIELRWSGVHPGTILVERSVGGRTFAIGSRGEPYGTEEPEMTPEPVVPCAAAGCEGTDPTPTTRQPPDTLPPTGPDPVPADALALLPERPAAEDPAVGEPFGGEGNCFVSGYRRFALPTGTMLVGTEGGPDGTTVLAVDDVDAAMEALVADAFEDDPAFTPGPIEDVALADGTTVRGTSVGIDGGGGGCGFLGSPDGRHLLVTMSSD